MVSHLREAVPKGNTQGSGIQSNLVLPRIPITAKIQKKDAAFLLAIKLWESKKNKFHRKTKHLIELAQLQVMNNFMRGKLRKKETLSLFESSEISFSQWGGIKAAAVLWG